MNDVDSAPEDHKTVISISGVSKVFRGAVNEKTLKERLIIRSERSPGFVALDRVSFDVYKGETFGILGHNGSGKSTLLKLVARIMRPTEGTIAVEGRLAALLELGAGFHPDLTGRENIFLNGSILGLERSYIEAQYEEIVAFAELERFIRVPVRNYSSGMRARLGFSVATHLQPDILLVDEVLSVGDEAFQEKCMERVHKFRTSGRTMVLVSHSAARVIQLCDRAAVLDGGRLIHLGEPAEAVEAYRDALQQRVRRTNKAVGQPPTAGLAAGRPFGFAATGFGPGDGSDADVITSDVEPRRDPVDVAADVDSLIAAEEGVPLPASQQPGASARESRFEIAPGGDLPFWVDVEAQSSGPVRVRVVLRNREGMALVNRATNAEGGGPLEVAGGESRVRFNFRQLPLRSGTYSIDVFLESLNGKVHFDHRTPMGSFTVSGVPEGLGQLLVGLDHELAADDTPPEPTPTRRSSSHLTPASS